jgi:hypothetical protein
MKKHDVVFTYTNRKRTFALCLDKNFKSFSRMSFKNNNDFQFDMKNFPIKNMDKYVMFLVNEKIKRMGE